MMGSHTMPDIAMAGDDVEENRSLIDTVESVDALNARFYTRFPYPRPPVKFDRLVDPRLQVTMLNQDVGDWRHTTVPAEARIWVAGCGTNQAIFTAMRFPLATVLGSDTSTEALQVCARNAEQLGLANLRLRHESINSVEYRDEFDYIICTGVIHHNADPERALSRLSAALRAPGVLELMVYNRFHRIKTSAFQRAVRILTGCSGASDFEEDLRIARMLLDGFAESGSMRELLGPFRDAHESMLADALVQPVEQSFTVESLNALVEACGLQIILPCVNQFDEVRETFWWNMTFNQPALRERYDALPDVQRWQVTNLLCLESSPGLWFYVRRRTVDGARQSERDIVEGFLNTPFERTSTQQQNYLLRGSDRYEPTPKTVAYPAHPPHESVRAIWEAARPGVTMRDVFRSLGKEISFARANAARVLLTTTAFPHLRAGK